MRIARILVLVAAIAALLGVFFMQSRRDTPDTLPALMARHGLSAASVAYGRAGTAPQFITIGTTPDSVMPYYSLSKPLTAAAVVRQVELGQMRLEDEYSGASLRQLLQHTGGWDSAALSYPVIERRGEPDCTALPAPEKQFAPGERYSYSNIGYCLLGRALEEATGLGYADAVRASFPEARAMEYDGFLGPAGGWSGTAETFFTFASRPIPPVTIQNLVPRPGDTPYGLGWGVGEDGTLSHFGWLEEGNHFAAAVRSGNFVAVALFEGVPSDPDQAKRELRLLLPALADQEGGIILPEVRP